MSNDIDFKKKYLKYKMKYNRLFEQNAGTSETSMSDNGDASINECIKLLENLKKCKNKENIKCLPEIVQHVCNVCKSEKGEHVLKTVKDCCKSCDTLCQSLCSMEAVKEEPQQ